MEMEPFPNFPSVLDAIQLDSNVVPIDDLVTVL